MTTEKTGRSKRGYFLPGSIALVALVALGLFVGAGDLSHPAPSTLVGSDIGAQIGLGIQTEENTASMPDVACPPKEPVRQGLRFTCMLRGRAPRTVYVTEVDGRGRVRWSFSP